MFRLATGTASFSRKEISPSLRNPDKTYCTADAGFELETRIMCKRMPGYFALPLLLLFAMPLHDGRALTPPEAFAPGPDVIMGNLPTLIQAGSNGTQVGLMMGTDICNNGDVPVNWFRLPETDHPVIPQNLYRMSGGTNNNDRFEQIGQSWAMHQFFPLQNNACGFGCTASPDSAHLGVGCSTSDTAGLNASPQAVGSRAWINPFTGIFPSTANSHTGHTHDGTTHRILVEGSDLNPAMNPGATYYGEAQLVTAHEYAWCQSHPGQCNMFNNVSYRQFAVTGTTSFSFATVGATVRETPALFAWPGATVQIIEPEPGVDGRAYLAYKVTQFGPWEWHYEYAIYNENLDRGINYFSVPAGCGIGSATNVAFHAPLNHPGFADDGTVGNAGYSNAPWSIAIGDRRAFWFTETFAQNPNANALRWGTLYNFRFDGGPPISGTAGIGFFKTGTAVTLPVQGPAPECTPTIPPPSPTATVPPTATPSPTFDPPPTPTATATATASPTATICDKMVTQNFDSVSAPALPPGWSSADWVTSTTDPDTAPNDAFVIAPSFVSDRRLDSVGLSVISPSATVAFRNNYNLESSGSGEYFDGAVLEISSPNINGGAFTDVTDSAVGGNLLFGGYDGRISTDFLNPLAGRYAWSGNSGGYINTLVNLGPNVNGQTIRLRFRMGSDFVGRISGGWRIDTISFGGVCHIVLPTPTPTASPNPPPTPTPTPTPTPSGTPGPTATPAQALNISTRLRVETGDRVLIGGFIITENPSAASSSAGSERRAGRDSSGPSGLVKTLAIRGIGPSLAQFGIPGFLTDPTIELRDSTGHLFYSNDNWLDSPSQAAVLTALGLGLQHPNESGVIINLSLGSYTVILAGKNGGTGVGLVEIYDTNPDGSFQLGNVSTRGHVQAGDNVMIGGFILGGDSGHTQLAVRGIGPSLAAFPFPNALADPTLELHDGNGGLIISNDDWQSDPAMAAQLTATGLGLGNPKEPGIFISLPPGLFTAILAGKDGGTGIGVVEIYNIGAP
jgi:hypothetical protein